MEIKGWVEESTHISEVEETIVEVVVIVEIILPTSINMDSRITNRPSSSNLSTINSFKINNIKFNK